MRRFLLAALLALSLAGGARDVFAESNWTWSTSLDTVVGFGDTRYLMEELAPYWVSSELIFPLNTLLERIAFRGERHAGHRDGRMDWGFEASLAVSLLAPFGRMEDYDWWMDPYYPKAAWSYTESDARLIWLLGSASWEPVLTSGGWGALAAVLGYRIQYMYQEANGYIGWQYLDLLPDNGPVGPDPTDGDGQPELYGVEYSDDYVVLTYWILWNAATAGLSATLRPGPGVSVRAEAGLAVAYVADEDDHVLRHKLSTASGLGFGAYAELAVRYSWGKSRVRPFFSLFADVLAMKADTGQIQTWYTGATEGTPGTSDGPYDHQISTKQFTAGLAFGVTY